MISPCIETETDSIKGLMWSFRKLQLFTSHLKQTVANAAASGSCWKLCFWILVWMVEPFANSDACSHVLCAHRSYQSQHLSLPLIISPYKDIAIFTSRLFYSSSPVLFFFFFFLQIKPPTVHFLFTAAATCPIREWAANGHLMYDFCIVLHRKRLDYKTELKLKF